MVLASRDHHGGCLQKAVPTEGWVVGRGLGKSSTACNGGLRSRTLNF